MNLLFIKFVCFLNNNPGYGFASSMFSTILTMSNVETFFKWFGILAGAVIAILTIYTKTFELIQIRKRYKKIKHERKHNKNR